MYAVFAEVDAEESVTEAGRDFLNRVIAPMAREQGAAAGYWLAPAAGRGVAVIVFDTEDKAREAAGMMPVGKPPHPEAPEGVTLRTVEVREVLASV
jgi:hypothetical protein